jgi:hypothetical protein
VAKPRRQATWTLITSGSARPGVEGPAKSRDSFAVPDAAVAKKVTKRRNEIIYKSRFSGICDSFFTFFSTRRVNTLKQKPLARIIKLQKGIRRVLLVLGWYDYRLHRGIERFAQECDWHLSEDLAREKVIPWGWDGDGILAWLGEGDDLADFVVQAKKPTVDFRDRKSTRLNSSHMPVSRMPSSA